MQTQTATPQPQNLPTPPVQLVTPKQLAELIPAYQGRPGAIRWQIFNGATNGLNKSGAILRNGRRILIDVAKYFDWYQRTATENPGEKHAANA